MNKDLSKDFLPISAIISDIAAMKMFLNDITDRLIKILSNESNFSYEDVKKIIDQMNIDRGIN